MHDRPDRTYRLALVAGILLAVFPGVLLAWDFTYDAAGRLTAVQYSPSHRAEYEYNLGGNLTNVAFAAARVETDSDADGMADAWELVYFNALSAAADGDPNQDTVDNLTHFLNGTDPVNPDSDGDGLFNAHEQQAGTDPLDPKSCFQLETICRQAGGVVLQWQSVAGKTYVVERAENLNGSAFSNILSAVPATPVLNVVTDFTAGAASSGFYRIRLDE